MKTYYIGIDDTDNQTSRGTGFRSRDMGHRIEENGLGKILGITRHQLFFDPRIPYTSHNSSACLVVEAKDRTQLTGFCRNYLLETAADGSDVGLCVALPDEISERVINWGYRAKKEVITQTEAKEIANQQGLYLIGLTGTHDGIIGALAAIGLRFHGNDGRFIWLKGQQEMREIAAGNYSKEALTKLLGVSLFLDLEMNEIQSIQSIQIADWLRPILHKHKITLLLESTNPNGNDWKIAPKEFIKSHSN